MTDTQPIKLRFVIEGEGAIPLADFRRSVSEIEGFLGRCCDEAFKRLQGDCQKLEFEKKPPFDYIRGERMHLAGRFAYRSVDCRADCLGHNQRTMAGQSGNFEY